MLGMEVDDVIEERIRFERRRSEVVFAILKLGDRLLTKEGGTMGYALQNDFG